MLRHEVELRQQFHMFAQLSSKSHYFRHSLLRTAHIKQHKISGALKVNVCPSSFQNAWYLEHFFVIIVKLHW